METFAQPQTTFVLRFHKTHILPKASDAVMSGVGQGDLLLPLVRPGSSNHFLAWIRVATGQLSHTFSSLIEYTLLGANCFLPGPCSN